MYPVQANSAIHVCIISVTRVNQDHSHSVIEFALDRTELCKAFKDFYKIIACYDHGIPCITAILAILQSKAHLHVRSLYAIVVYHRVDATHSFRIHLITYIIHRGLLFHKIMSNKTMNFNDYSFSPETS